MPSKPKRNWLQMRQSMLAMVLVAVVFTGCPSPEEPTAPHQEPQQAPPSVVTGVRIAPIELQTVSEVIEAIGTVRSQQQSVLSSRIVAVVVAVHVREGERVSAGQLLIELDDRVITAELRRAEAGLSQAQNAVEEVEQAIRGAQSAIEASKAQAEVARSTLERFKMLLERRSVAPQEYDEVVARHKAAAAEVRRAQEERAALLAKQRQVQSRIEQAKAEVAAASIVVGFAKIRAPLDGIVVHKAVEVGTLASPGVPLCTIEAERYRMEASVQESEIKRIRIGQQATVVLDALEQEVVGPVEEIVPVLDPLSRTFTVKISLPPEPGLRSGLYGKVRFPVGQRQVLVVPRTALVERGQLEGVFAVEEDNIAHLRLVRTGKAYGDRLEILSGLRAGERVIVEGVDRVSEGSRVEG